jgi:hypothetical protein
MNYKQDAFETKKSKAKSMGKENNLVIPVMRAVGENKKGGIHESSANGQHQKKAAAPGFKRGGGVDKPVQFGAKMTAGARSGEGRLQKTHLAAKNR